MTYHKNQTVFVGPEKNGAKTQLKSELGMGWSHALNIAWREVIVQLTDGLREGKEEELKCRGSGWLTLFKGACV